MRRLLLLVLIASCPLSAAAQLQKGDLIAICGDSITEQREYSVFIETYLVACQPQLDVRVSQFGWNGDTSWGFLTRVDDVLRFKPNVVTTCFGMNDGGYEPLVAERAARYRESLRAIVQRLKAGGTRLIVIGSPGVVDADTYKSDDPDADRMYNKTLGQMRRLAGSVASESGATFADVYETMMDVMTKTKQKYGSEYHLAGGDGVHPMSNGHLVMAYAFLKALKCDGEIGTIRFDMSSDKAEASEGHKIMDSGGGIVEVVSQRYPFCFEGVPETPESTRGVVEFMPFNQDLNRLMLIVTNASAPRVRVSWGSEIKEYSAADLAKGINLAAEFMNNPFVESFNAVETAVRAQQEFEVLMMKQHFASLRLFRELLPADKATFDRVSAALIAQDRKMQDAARAAVKPVRHIIIIEPVK